MTQRPKLLVLGLRNGLARALRRRGIEPWVWNDLPLERVPARRLLVRPFPRSRPAIEAALTPWLRGKRFTHVVAAKETAVYAASIVRRLVGARASSHTTVLRCRDKLRMKQFLQLAGIPMTPFAAGRDRAGIEELRRRAGYPLVVKERLGVGGRNMEFLSEAPAGELKGRLVEAFVDAPEVSVESFVDGGRIQFTNITQYHTKGAVNLVPDHLPDLLRTEVLALNARVLKQLDVEWGMTHLELYLHPEGLLFGEVGLRPPGGYIMDLLERAYDFDPWEAFLCVELGLPLEAPLGPVRLTACEILHPGAGVVRSITGREEVAALKTVEHITLRVEPGSVIQARDSVSRDVGHILHSAQRREQLLDSIARSQALLRIELEPTAGA